VFVSGFLARARATDAFNVVEELRRQCLEVAPSPGSQDDPLFASTSGER
jgi:hypothetical protein